MLSPKNSDVLRRRPRGVSDLPKGAGRPRSTQKGRGEDGAGQSGAGVGVFFCKHPTHSLAALACEKQAPKKEYGFFLTDEVVSVTNWWVI